MKVNNATKPSSKKSLKNESQQFHKAQLEKSLKSESLQFHNDQLEKILNTHISKIRI
jgi:hypothetical protein